MDSESTTLKRHSFRWWLGGLLCGIAVTVAAFQVEWSTPVYGDTQVYFSPRGGCTEAVIANLNAATNSIYVQAYSFTSAPIAKGLVDAHKRGVHVEIILDKSQKGEKYSSADFVQRAGIPTYIDSKHAIAHNKIMIIDGYKLLTGSFNFTSAAENSNAENLLVIVNSRLARVYSDNWKAHAAHEVVYQGRPPLKEH